MLRKLNKEDYIQLNIYKLITCKVNTISKALKSIITIKLNY